MPIDLQEDAPKIIFEQDREIAEKDAEIARLFSALEHLMVEARPYAKRKPLMEAIKAADKCLAATYVRAALADRKEGA